jgi:hypothetical protein
VYGTTSRLRHAYSSTLSRLLLSAAVYSSTVTLMG